MNVTFENCGNIKYAKLNIIPNKLNIKYGFNGTGKTTLGKCLSATILGDSNSILHYVPYGSKDEPKVDINGIQSILYFDKDYVENYLFKENLINRSFEIVVKTSDYDEKMMDINELLNDLNVEIKDEIINSATSNISDLDDSIKFNKQGNFIGNSSFAKGIKKLNPEKYLSEDVLIYKDLITSPENFSWIDWFKKGEQYIMNNRCPFCSAMLPSDFEKKYNLVNVTFNKNDLKNNKDSNSKLSLLKNLVDEDTSNQILQDQIVGAISDKTKELIKNNIEFLSIEKAKLESISSIDPVKLVALSKREITAMFEEFKLNEELFANISNELLVKAKKINDKLENLICKIDLLNEKIIGLKIVLSKRIKKVSKFVNDFLDIAGIPYRIEVSCAGQQDAKTILKAKNYDFEIQDPKTTLSFGELNSISLVLFCVEAICHNYDLIVLDDPVSSFDGNKKYAIMYQLFSAKVERNLLRKTVLFFTHDLTPVIDFIYNGLPIQNESKAYYLYNKNGILSESEIKKSDIISCIHNELESASNTSNNELHRVVSLRNYYDMTKLNESLEYSLLSSLLHLNDKPRKKDETPFTKNEIESALVDIRKYIVEFDFFEMQKLFSNKEILKEWFFSGSSLDKIVTTRILLTIEAGKNDNKVLWKFINENFHSQNSLFYGLNSLKFELIPEYILQSCEELFEKV